MASVSSVAKAFRLGSEVAATPGSINDTLPHAVSATITGLQDNTLYYYRLKVQTALDAGIDKRPEVIEDLRNNRIQLAVPPPPNTGYLVERKVVDPAVERIFKRRYKQPYDWFIRREHINSPSEIISVLERHFTIRERSFFPFPVPIKDINLCIGLLATRREATNGR